MSSKPLAGSRQTGRRPVGSGDPVTVDVVGTTIVEAGGTIAKGALIETNASGQAITRAAGPIIARALSAAVAGQRMEVLLITN